MQQVTRSSLVAAVSGGNKGIGFAACKGLAQQGFRVVLGARDAGAGQQAEQQLKAEGLDVAHCPLDVTDQASVKSFASWLEERYGRCDVLVNNAGIMTEYPGKSFLDIDIETIDKVMRTNTYGPLLLSQAIVPLMKQQRSGRIINVSSTLGQLSTMNGKNVSYRLSKVALNGLTRIMAAELQEFNIQVHSMCPGWVATDLGTARAPKTPEQGAETVLWLATTNEDLGNGGFFKNKQRIPW
ncbi:Short-chain dehydrogenase [Balamuthia mandrillaris]